MDRRETERREVGRSRGTRNSPVTGEIDLAPFQEAFRQSGMTLSEVARRLGYWRPDQPRAGRLLGFHRDHGSPHRQVTYAKAVELCAVLDLDPVDAGL